MTQHLVLSPHPDDAVWSAGGRIAGWVRAGEPVTVLTVFDGPAGSDGGPADQPPAGGWRRMADPAVRRAEDRDALDLLGARLVQAGLPDAALRVVDGRPRYSSRLRLFASPHESDRGLVTRIAGLVADLLDTTIRLHVPLAAGRHVDHVLVRAAAESLPDCALEYYEDFPYRLAAADHRGLVADLHEVRADGWLRAALRYRSQVDAMFGSCGAFARALLTRARQYGRAIGARYAERTWTRAAGVSEAPAEFHPHHRSNGMVQH